MEKSEIVGYEPLVKFIVEPVFQALNQNDTKELFEILGVQRMPITQKNRRRCGSLLKKI